MAAIPSRLASPILRRAQLPERTIGTNFPDRGKRNCQSRLHPFHRRENVRLFHAKAEQILPSPHLTAALIPWADVQDAEAEILRRIEFLTTFGRAAVTARRTAATPRTRTAPTATGTAPTTPRGTAWTTPTPRTARPLLVILAVAFVPIAALAVLLVPVAIVQLVLVPLLRRLPFRTELDSPRFFLGLGIRRSRPMRRSTCRPIPVIRCQIKISIFWIMTDKLLQAHLRRRRRGTSGGRSRGRGRTARSARTRRIAWILAGFCFLMTIRCHRLAAVGSPRCPGGSGRDAVCQIRSISTRSIGGTVGWTRAATHTLAPVRVQQHSAFLS